jgi:predicted RNA-binding Zn-ribbon protein involved in translation (DUF1610 family)
LLLFKQKLSELSPQGSDEALLKERVMPEIAGSTILWRGKGKKTVDVQNIRDRFDSLNISVDWQAFDSINRIRNEIEHYYTTANNKVIAEAIAKSFGISSEFLTNQLQVDPKSQFSQKTWDVFIAVKDVYDKERAQCDQSQANIDTESEYVLENTNAMSCDDCGSDLILVDAQGDAHCRSCSKTWDRSALIVAIVEKASYVDNYISVKDGAEPITCDCPECGESAFIVEEMRCAVCGEAQQAECERCGTTIPIAELDGSGYCDYCNHMMSKDD